MISLLLAAALSGLVPAALGSASRVAWVSPDASSVVACSLAEPTRWSCEADAPSDVGVVVVVGDNGVAFTVRAGPRAETDDGDMQVRRHGRLVVVTGDLPPEGEPVRAVATAVDRSAARPNTTRFSVKPLDVVDLLAVSRASLWVAWDEVDEDAYLSVSSDGMATTRVSFASLADGDVAQPLLISASPPLTLAGRVEDTRGDALASTDVELLAPFDTPPVHASDADVLALPMVQIERTQTDEAGAFAFDRLGPGPFVALVTDPMRGRGRTVIRSPLEPVTIRVTPPPAATGRVLYHDVPVPAARVRFVPNVQTLAAAVDVRDAASVDQQTDQEGRFSLALPPTAVGVVQVIGPDGNTVRVPLLESRATRDIDLGDISLPNHRRLTVRLTTTEACVLSAVGPLGTLGVSMIAESAAASNLHWFNLPEPGQWMLDADCDGRAVPLVPSIVTIPADGPDVTLDARLVGRH